MTLRELTAAKARLVDAEAFLEKHRNGTEQTVDDAKMSVMFADKAYAKACIAYVEARLAPSAKRTKRMTRAERIKQIEGDIRYEQHESGEEWNGHTYHMCNCGRGFTRRYGCIQCLEEEKQRLLTKKGKP